MCYTHLPHSIIKKKYFRGNGSTALTNAASTDIYNRESLFCCMWSHLFEYIYRLALLWRFFMLQILQGKSMGHNYAGMFYFQ